MDSSEPECDVSGKLKSTPTASESLPSTGPTCGDGMTCGPSRQMESGASMLSAVDSHAKTSAQLTRGEPGFVVVENVPNLSVLGLDHVLGGLADCGFDAEWATIPASSFGAPQSRRRMFIVAYAMCERWEIVLRRDSGTLNEASPWGEWQSHAPDSPCGVLQAVEQVVGESSVLRSSDGILSAVDRLRVIGNAVVPQVAQWIGRRIVEAANH